MINVLNEKLDLLGESFFKLLIDKEEHSKLDATVIEVSPTVFSFDWFQGVGLYGFYKLYKYKNNKKYWQIMLDYYQDQISKGLPRKNINSMTPFLTLCFLNEELKNKEYDKLIQEWAQYLYQDMPRTTCGGFQHITSENHYLNQLWDDTLFMSVLFLAKAGVVYRKEEYVEEAIYQFLKHAQYLLDNSSGLWFHGYDCDKKNNFGAALWGRGNSWITIFIPEFLEILEDYPLNKSLRQYIIDILNLQVAALALYQHQSGLWHTLIDDSSSYLEASATAGFGFGILKAIRKQYIDKRYESNGLKALTAIINNINKEGVVQLVSGGTRMGETKEFYKTISLSPEPYGQAMAMLFLIEALVHI